MEFFGLIDKKDFRSEIITITKKLGYIELLNFGNTRWLANNAVALNGDTIETHNLYAVFWNYPNFHIFI